MAILSHGFDPPSVPNSITGHARLNTFLGNFINTYAPETVGVEDLEADRFTLYPNPCNQKLSIVGLNGRQIDYTVIDMAGKTIAIGTTGSDIATDEIAPGFYQLLLDNASYKFLVHR